MNENMNMGLSPEEKKKQQEKEDDEFLADYFARHPEIIISPEDRREAGSEIAEFENIIALFESKHSLESLHSITDLTPQEAPNHILREPARVALIPIVALLNTLENETNISKNKYEELKAEYMRLSRAVGIINKNKVDHTR